MAVLLCPPGGAVGHRAADLQSAEETRGHCHTQKKRGNHCDLADLTQWLTMLLVPFISECCFLQSWIASRCVCVCVAFRLCGRTWSGRWRESESCSSGTGSCWWRERRWPTPLRNTEPLSFKVTQMCFGKGSSSESKNFSWQNLRRCCCLQVLQSVQPIQTGVVIVWY